VNHVRELRRAVARACLGKLSFDLLHRGHPAAGTGQPADVHTVLRSEVPAVGKDRRPEIPSRVIKSAPVLTLRRVNREVATGSTVNAAAAVRSPCTRTFSGQSAGYRRDDRVPSVGWQAGIRHPGTGLRIMGSSGRDDHASAIQVEPCSVGSR
jgi:hypothetical protein